MDFTIEGLKKKFFDLLLDIYAPIALIDAGKMFLILSPIFAMINNNSNIEIIYIGWFLMGLGGALIFVNIIKTKKLNYYTTPFRMSYSLILPMMASLFFSLSYPHMNDMAGLDIHVILAFFMGLLAMIYFFCRGIEQSLVVILDDK